jgi:hypothetical protein
LPAPDLKVRGRDHWWQKTLERNEHRLAIEQSQPSPSVNPGVGQDAASSPGSSADTVPVNPPS